VSELAISSRTVEEAIVIYPRGFINAHTVRDFEQELQRALDQGLFKIVINGADLSYIASAGLGAIMGAIEEVRENGGDIRIAALNATVFNIFDLLGFTHLYRIYNTENEALTSFVAESSACGGADA
jgi:anti-sigma B factor antagonist